MDPFNCKQCDNHSPDIIGALDHLEDDHSDLPSVTGSPYVCVIFAISYPTRELFQGHLVLVSQVSTSHIAIVKPHNIWYPAPTIVQSGQESRCRQKREEDRDSSYGVLEEDYI
jgi:hypothetical protein